MFKLACNVHSRISSAPPRELCRSISNYGAWSFSSRYLPVHCWLVLLSSYATEGVITSSDSKQTDVGRRHSYRRETSVEWDEGLVEWRIWLISPTSQDFFPVTNSQIKPKRCWSTYFRRQVKPQILRTEAGASETSVKIETVLVCVGDITHVKPLSVGRNSSVGTATRYGLDGPGIESWWGGEIFRTRPDKTWCPLNLLYNGYRVIPGGKAARAWR